jgi:hypothetical protein
MAQSPLTPPSSVDISRGLKRIRFRRKLSHAPFLSAFAIGGFMALLKVVAPSVCSAIAQNQIYQLGFSLLIAVGGICALFVSVMWMKCPRCGELFHCGERYRNDFTRKCLHCGLRLDGSNIGL